MILDVPTSADFLNSAKMFLNLAWDIVSNLYFDIHNSRMDEWDDDGSISDEFWDAARTHLINSVLLTQQGMEFLLISKIAEIFPFSSALTIAPANGTANCQMMIRPSPNSGPFDAQDLVKVHDATCQATARLFISK
jgi:hypothetical protein